MKVIYVHYCNHIFITKGNAPVLKIQRFKKVYCVKNLRPTYSKILMTKSRSRYIGVLSGLLYV